MPKDLKIVIEVDDKFTRQSLADLKRVRAVATKMVGRQRREIHKNWLEWATGVVELRDRGIAGFGQAGGGQAGGGGGGGGSGGVSKTVGGRRKTKKEIEKEEAERKKKAIIAKWDKKRQRSAPISGISRFAPARLPSTWGGVGRGAAGQLAASGLAARIPPGVSKAAGAAARVAVPLAVAWAAWKLAKTANNGLAYLSGMFGSPDLADISNAIGESVFDKPDMWMAGANKASAIASAFSRGKSPLSAKALSEIYEFGYMEERWRKQRERRAKNQFGEAFGESIGHLTGFGGN